MGHLRAWKLSPEFVRAFPIFVETGTYLGDGLAYAAEHPFRRLYSIDINNERVDAARERFKKDKRILVMRGDSANGLWGLAKQIRQEEATCFWLDAHFPYGDQPGDPPGKVANFNMPLADELEEIRYWPARHCLIIDDLRIYDAETAYEDGPLPSYLRDQAPPTGLDFLPGGPNWHREIHLRHGGYAVIVPEGLPRPVLVEETIHDDPADHDPARGVAGRLAERL